MIVDLAWALFTGTAWLFVIVWLAPFLVANKREHRNKHLILALSVIASLWPVWSISALAWVILIIYASLTEPKLVFIQGPEGRRGKDGQNGKDGKPGQQGSSGRDGLTPYELYMINHIQNGKGHMMSEGDFLDMVENPPAPLSKRGFIRQQKGKLQSTEE